MTSCVVKYNDKLTSSIEMDAVDAYKYSTSPYSTQVMPLIDTYRASASLPVSSIDEDLLISNTSDLTFFIQTSKNESNTFSRDYPYLNDRIELNPFITPAETDLFISTNILNATTFTDNLTPYNVSMLELLNSFFGPDNFTSTGMSSFCSLVPNIFAEYTKLKDAFSQVELFVEDFNQMLTDITDFSLATMLLDLKNQLYSVVDAMVSNVKNKISEFSALYTDVSMFNYNKDGVHSKIIKDRDAVNAYTSDTAVDSLKLMLDGAVSFTSSLFESLNIEEIQFIILRFCELVSNLERFFSDVTRPLQDTMDNYQNSYYVLKGSSSYATARAIAAGALRFGVTERSDGMLTIAGLQPTPGPLTADAGIAVDGAIEGGAAVRQRSARAMPITALEANEVSLKLSYDAVSSGSSEYVVYQPGPHSASSGRLGWDNVRPLEKVMLMRLAKALGYKLYINSAWRSLATQAEIRVGDEANIPKSGYHQSGQAFDVSRQSISSETMFINTARGLGFGGIGRYDTFIHIDSRASDVTFR